MKWRWWVVCLLGAMGATQAQDQPHVGAPALCPGRGRGLDATGPYRFDATPTALNPSTLYSARSISAKSSSPMSVM